MWEEEDHMEKQDFDPKTFFAMHDLNGDGVLDEQEVEAILQLEAKKMYMSDPQNPGDPRVSIGIRNMFTEKTNIFLFTMKSVSHNWLCQLNFKALNRNFCATPLH